MQKLKAMVKTAEGVGPFIAANFIILGVFSLFKIENKQLLEQNKQLKEKLNTPKNIKL